MRAWRAARSTRRLLCCFEGDSNPRDHFHFLVAMAHLMVIAETEFTANAIDQALTQRGHLVTTATDFTHIEPSCTGLVFDLAVLSLNISSKVKQAILLQLREYCPNVPVLDMCLPGACVTGADYSVMSDSFEELATAVTAMLHKKENRKAG
jgi:DNA-binding response OmpR family regulator